MRFLFSKLALAALCSAPLLAAFALLATQARVYVQGDYD